MTPAVKQQLLHYFDAEQLAPGNNTTLGGEMQNAKAGALENLLFLLDNRDRSDRELTDYFLSQTSHDGIGWMAFHIHQNLEFHPQEEQTFAAYLHLQKSAFNSETPPWYEANGSQLGMSPDEYSLECVRYVRSCVEAYLLQFSPGELLPENTASAAAKSDTTAAPSELNTETMGAMLGLDDRYR